MKATLTIEVPNDFEKGFCKICPLYEKDNPYFFESVCQKLTNDYCPLEIQEEPEEDRCIGCIHKGVFNDIGICLKCNDYNFYKQENNQ